MTQSHYYRRTHTRKIRTKSGTRFIQVTHKRIKRPKSKKR